MAKPLLLDAAILCACKLVVDAFVLHAGFTHVSDDDYARTVISEQFAHAPRFDPSGTSWLPLPFWVAGAVMAQAGRSLGVARAIAIVAGAAGVLAPYAAMRTSGMARAPAIGASVVAMALPWNAWLGVATVPDGWTGALLAAGAIAMVEPRARPWAAAALFLASLSRYEAWPVCATFALFSILKAARGEGDVEPARPSHRRRDVLCAVAALAGPAMWMAWNAHAHGSPVHFVARVTAFRRSIGAADVSAYDKLLDFPRALVTETPEASALGACGLAGLMASAALRKRWAWPAVAGLAVLAFLVIGDLGDGAPTHHPSRALVSLWWLLVGMGVDAIAAAATLSPERTLRVVTACAASAGTLAWVASLPSRFAAAPGRSESETRGAQIARGLELRALDVSSAEITPCEFEQFALIAAWGEPERARVNARTREAVTADCPRVVAR